MNWILVLCGVAACVICGFLGLTAGINMNPESTVRFVPNWGSAGDWVSGIGALLAVIVTLLLADKQRREDAELLKVVANASFPVGPGFYGLPFISVELTSEGKRPVTVTGLNVTSPHSKMRVQITDLAQHSPDKLPVRLEYGQRASIHLQAGAEIQIAQFVLEHCGNRTDGLKFVVNTTTGYWEGHLSKGLFRMRETAAKLSLP